MMWKSASRSARAVRAENFVFDNVAVVGYAREVMRKVRLAIMGSGSGTNCQFILNAIKKGKLKAKVVMVLSDHKDARILERARHERIATEVMNCKGYKNKFPLEEQTRIAQMLKKREVDIVCLAGFMRLVKEPLLRAFPNRILNIHPALLPNFPGMEAWTQALHAKVKRTGCTVHYVDAGMDSGEIIMQRNVRIKKGDTPETLHKRIQTQEHILYPLALDSIISHYKSQTRANIKEARNNGQSRKTSKNRQRCTTRGVE